MKIAIIAAVKNEEDVIESFVRHNLNFADEIHLIDHVSGDSTPEILRRLGDEGLPVSFGTSNHAIRDHAQVITRTAREKFGTRDFVVPLDADEFISASSRGSFEAELAKVGPGQAGLMFWKTYLLGAARGPNFLHEAVARRAREHLSYGKVVVRGALLRDGGSISIGNHLAFDVKGGELPLVPLETALAHLPVRSSLQMVSKVILGAYSFAMSPGRLDQTSAHWLEIAAEVRKNGYVFTPRQLDELAMNYCNDRPRPDCEITMDPIPRFANTDLRYADLMCGSLLERFDKFIGQTVEKVGAAKSMASMIGSI